jgi:hypothetical protein
MNTLIAVAGGLIAVYAIFALITSHIGEWIGNRQNKRGETLYDGIKALLSATKQPLDVAVPAAGKDLTSYLYAHPLISNLGIGTDKPSYIPARTFTLSLIGSLRDFTLKHHPDTNQPILPALDALAPDLLKDLNTRVQALDVNDPLRKSLTLVIEGANGRYEDVLKGIDGWYDSQMDRITGSYKRWTGRWQTGIALVVVVLFNVDTIALAHSFLHSTALADAVAGLARGAAGANPPADNDLLKQFAATGLPIGWNPPILAEGEAWWAKVAGLLVTWFAVLLGAPFWFDLLKKFVPVRQTGTKPQPSTGSPPAAGDAQSRGTEPA